MNCDQCGAKVLTGSNFCSSCGAPVTSGACPKCRQSIQPGDNFCQHCGQELKEPEPARSNPAPLPAGIKSDLKDLMPGEIVLMDTGVFPISYIKGLASSTNGKLYLTSQRLVFKASKLQGVGGVFTPVGGGVFIPNPNDAKKYREYFAIPLSEIASVTSGWASLTVTAGGQKFKFGGMRKTGEWLEAVKRAAGLG